ncbi:MAG: amidohydrolase family protein, partial [Anaerolineales bacterium]|nr:amidohydrolase family protein [Anaerolineales bacterium]
VSSDDWLTGTVAAACGGTTTVVDFVEALPGERWMQAFAARRARAEAQAVIDFGLHMSFNRADAASLAQVRPALRAGVASFKIYMAYDGIRLTDPEMLLALDTLAAEGGLAIVHAENHYVIMHRVAQHLAQGRTAPRWHPHTRPALAEAEATERVLTMAALAGAPVHIVHVSAAEGLAAIRRFRKRRGSAVTGEVCTQHLLLTGALYDQEGFEPAKYSMAPPLRTAADNAALWAGLRDGALDFVVTDHCPFTLAQKRGERRTPEFRRRPDGIHPTPAEEPWSHGLPPFNQIPGGAPGVETRLALTYHFGVNAGRLTLPQFVNVTSTAAARLYGLYPRKGTLAPGSDADVVLFDPARAVTIRAEQLRQNTDYTPYEGMQVRGWPRTVISRGEVIVRDHVFVGAAGRGRFLARQAAASLGSCGPTD